MGFKEQWEENLEKIWVSLILLYWAEQLFLEHLELHLLQFLLP